MTDRPGRAVVYARKSTKQDRTEEQSASVTDQLARCRAYAEQRGWTVVGEFEDDGRSGLLDRSKRPGLNDALTVIEEREADTLVTLWTSRLSRDERQRAEILDILDVFDVEWHVVEDGGLIDRKSYSGYLTYGVHTVFDVAFSKRVGENWRTAHRNRLKKGLPKTTAHRFGYRYDAAAKRYEPHPAEAEVVRELYRRYTRGEGFTPLVTWLNREGWRVRGWRKTENPQRNEPKRVVAHTEWTVRTLNRFLDSGFSAGYISREAKYRQLKGSHEPLITQAEWDAYRAERERRAPMGKAATARDRWWLGGLVTCGKCGGRTYVDSYERPDGKSSVLCAAHRANPDSCSGVTILRAYVERAVGWWLLPHLDRLDALADSESKATQDAAASAYGDAVAARDKVVEALAALEESRLLDGMDPAVYRRTRERLTARQHEAEKAVTEAASALAAPAPDLDALRQALDAGWTHDQRAALRGVLDRVEVSKEAVTIVPVVGEPVTRLRSDLAPRCLVDGCERQHYTRGLCKSHAMRARNRGVLDQVAQAVAESVEAPGPTLTVEDVEDMLSDADQRAE